MFGTGAFVDDDKLKRQIEEIRGRALDEVVPSGDDWTEVSDGGRLCARPVVSVVMITYNHEKFIAQALESIVTQKADFPFEVVIGEDCSTDGTRSICIDYQRRYPEIVRVIFPNTNTYKKYGSQVFNLAEVYRRCRGEFGAMCEGDDYWIDEQKLAKQVAVMRENPSVSFCWMRSKTRMESTGRLHLVSVESNAQFGLIKGKDFWRGVIDRTLLNMNTPSFLWRRLPQVELYAKLRFPAWNIMVGDVPLPMTAGYLGDAYRLQDIGAVYRVHGTSVCHITNGQVAIDNVAISAYFSYLFWHMPLEEFPYLPRAFRYRLLQIVSIPNQKERTIALKDFISGSVYRRLLRNKLYLLYYPIALFGRNSIRCRELVSEGVVWFVKVRVQAVVRVVLGRGNLR